MTEQEAIDNYENGKTEIGYFLKNNDSSDRMSFQGFGLLYEWKDESRKEAEAMVKENFSDGEIENWKALWNAIAIKGRPEMYSLDRWIREKDFKRFKTH